MKDGTEFLDELKDRVHDLYDENKRLKEENNLLKQIIGNDKKYSYGIRMGSDKE